MNDNEMHELTQELATLLNLPHYELGKVTSTQLKLSKSGLEIIISRLLTLGDYVQDLDKSTSVG